MTPSSTQRLAHIDAIRGIAALAVAYFHTAQFFTGAQGVTVEGGLLGEISYQLNLGYMGVIAFFAISGFVICPTLKGEKGSGSRRFITSRLFRLFPAYWISMLLIVAFNYLFFDRQPQSEQVLGNISMLFSFIGVKPLINVYWTLEVELIFYLLCLVLFLLGWLHKPMVLFIAGLLLMVCSEWIFSHPDLRWRIRSGTGGWYWPFIFWNLAIMFWGGLFRIWYDDRESVFDLLKHSFPVRYLVFGLLAVILARPVLSILVWVAQGKLWMIHEMSQFVGGLALFVVGALYIRLNNRFLVWLGTISYSVYLLHIVAIKLVHQYVIDPSIGWNDLHLGLYLLICFLVTIVMSALVYYLVEKPAISIGRQLNARWA